MREVLRIEHVKTEESQGNPLRDYSLELYEREIVYVQGHSGSGVKSLINVLSGHQQIKSGKIVLYEEKVLKSQQEIAAVEELYTVSAGRDLIEHFTAAENLAVTKSHAFPLKPYNTGKIEKKMSFYLAEEGFDIKADMPVWSLWPEEKNKLSILKAKIYGARVVVLDAAWELFEGKDAQSLCDFIRKMNAEGMSFLILAEHYTVFAEIATRVQVVQQGRDVKEWRGGQGVHAKLESGFVSAGLGRKKGRRASFTGLYDYEWEIGRDIWEYLAGFREHNSGIWDAHIGLDIPEKGESMQGGTLVIPFDSTDLLVEPLSVEDNIIVTVPRRVSGSRCGYIAKRIKKNAAAGYYKFAQTDQEFDKISDLTRVQKKILSIYRWELAKPERIVLESPYSGMDQEETELLRGYLRYLEQKGIRIFYFARTIWDMKEDCSLIFSARNGKNAKIATF